MLIKLCVLAVAINFASAIANIEEVLAWKQVPFAWPNEQTREAAIKSGEYIPNNNLPLGLERWNNKLFITIPRWKAGVAASLGYVDLSGPINKTAPIIPYPSWKANTLPKEGAKVDDEQIISTFRISVDACDRLWVMETGLADILGNPKQITAPAILIFDLKTDKLIKRYEIKPEHFKEDTFFANIVIDVTKDKCDKAFAYIADLGSNALVVYSFANDDAWRLTHNFFHFDPLQGNLTVGPVNFQWNDGLFDVALGPIEKSGFRTVYFHALASLNEFSVNSEVLQNKNIATDPHSYNLFKLEGFKGEDAQTSVSVFDEKTNVLFLTQLVKDGVACWNPKKPLNPKNVALVAQDHERLVFSNALKIDNDRNLWILSNRMPEFRYDMLDFNKVNYRVFKVKVDDAIARTPCAA